MYTSERKEEREIREKVSGCHGYTEIESALTSIHRETDKTSI